jgi:hypothetical protein
MSSGVGKIGPSDATFSLAQHILKGFFVSTGLVVPEIYFWENILFSYRPEQEQETSCIHVSCGGGRAAIY